MLAKALVIVSVTRFPHGGVHGGNDLCCVAPGVVTTEQFALQTIAHKGLRRFEHLRLGAAKAVNTLLWVTHNEHAGRCAAATACIAAQPRQQCLPLQGVGVLKLINQQVPDACVQALLHPASEHRVAQHDPRRALHVVHVDPAMLAFERAKLGNQQPGQARHALLVLPGVKLVPCRHDAQHQVLRAAHQVNARNLLAKLSGRAFLGQQRGKHSGHIAVGQGCLQLDPFGGKCGRAGPAQGFCSGAHEFKMRGTAGEKFLGHLQTAKLWKLLCKVQHGGIHHTTGIGQRELNALVQRHLQSFLALDAAVLEHHGFKVGLALRHSRQRGVEASPHLRFGRPIVFQQLIVGRQFKLLHDRQRRTAQQGGEPAMESANLHLTTARQNALI